MSRFVFFTKTNWDEPPRLRHQLAQLLISNNHQVIFFEKPSTYLFNKKQSAPAFNGIRFLRSKQLMHQKLRVTAFLRFLNEKFELRDIKKSLKESKISNSDIIVNFNYDYYFLRRLFPENKIITIINDDFWCRALFGYQKPLKDALELTCANSDSILTVSYPLMDQLSAYCTPRLFLPWTEQKYRHPNMEIKKSSLLFWGYINNRLNFDYISKLANALDELDLDITIDFVGPVESRIDSRFTNLKDHPKISTMGPTDLENLNFDRALAAFIPYVDGNKADDVTTIPNKAFPMLANGLPLLITGMPNFINESFVFRLGDNINKDINLIKNLDQNLHDIQSSIEKFVNLNTSEKRYQEFMAMI